MEDQIFGNYDFVDSRYDQLKFFLISSIVWTNLSFLVMSKIKLTNRFERKIENDIKNRIVSVVHGQFALWFSLYQVCYEGTSFNNFDERNTQLQCMILVISGAYFVYDLLACIYYGLYDNALLAHHLMCMLGYGSCLIIGYGGSACLFGVIYAEISNTAMHTRIVVKHYGLRNTKLYEVLDYIYLAQYFIARGIFTVVHLIIFCVFQSTMTPVGVKIICVGITLQSEYFVYQMIQILRRKIRHQKEKNKKNVHFYWFSINPKVADLSFNKKEVSDKVF